MGTNNKVAVLRSEILPFSVQGEVNYTYPIDDQNFFCAPCVLVKSWSNLSDSKISNSSSTHEIYLGSRFKRLILLN